MSYYTKIWERTRETIIKNIYLLKIKAINLIEDRPEFNRELPLWILGEKFDGHQDEHIMERLMTVLLFTYRISFPPIPSSDLTYDVGWGCMLRTGQMLIAQTLIKIHLGENWRYLDDPDNHRYQTILGQFQDQISSCYSIHQMTITGQKYGVNVGQWFGPTTLAKTIKHLMENNSNLKVQIGLRNVIDLNSITHFPTLILIPSTLGTQGTIDCQFIQPVLDFLKLQRGLGIVGGRNNYALYFIGIQSNNLLYFDPHLKIQSAFNEGEGENDRCDFHDIQPHLIQSDQISPSMLFAYLCRTPSDLIDLKNYSEEYGWNSPFHIGSGLFESPPDNEDDDLVLVG